MDQDEKVRINRLRRMATRQGYRLHKTRRVDPRATDYGTYRLARVKGGKASKDAPGHLLTIDEVENFLTRSLHEYVPGPAGTTAFPSR